MIDNVALILTGTLRNPTKEYMDELISKCHPLGYFPTLAAVSLAGTFESKLLPGTTAGIDNMFKEIMLETPLAVYFSSNFVTGVATQFTVWPAPRRAPPRAAAPATL